MTKAIKTVGPSLGGQAIAAREGHMSKLGKLSQDKTRAKLGDEGYKKRIVALAEKGREALKLKRLNNSKK